MTYVWQKGAHSGYMRRI